MSRNIYLDEGAEVATQVQSRTGGNFLPLVWPDSFGKRAVDAAVP
jgi:hypothetical protein